MLVHKMYDQQRDMVIKTLQSGYRIAQYNLIEAPTTWAYQYGVSGSVALAESLLNLPFVSHINNPYAADFDLAFGIPKQLYYAVNVAANSDPYAYTNNNLFNIYWWNFIQETVSRCCLQLRRRGLIVRHLVISTGSIAQGC